jgi:hypothetical protein
VTSGTASDPIALNTGGNTISVQVTAQDGVATTTYTVTVIRLTNLQTWRLTNFGTMANSGTAADTYDDSGDGLPNLLKYAFALDPASTTAAAQLPRPVSDGTNLTISFNASANVSGIAYTAEWTETLNPANWQPVSDTGSGAMHIFSMPIAGHPSLFMRLRVSEH